MKRRWALPVLIDLYRSPELDRAEGRPHKTPAQLMCRLLRLLLARFPGRTFVFTGDAGYGTHEVARFCHRHRARLTLVSKFRPDANLFNPPPPYAGKGRPRVTTVVRTVTTYRVVTERVVYRGASHHRRHYRHAPRRVRYVPVYYRDYAPHHRQQLVAFDFDLGENGL